ncbi:MAG: glycosyltransferase [Clostridia bacterium]|nr:glycosyltransferase [Clostridia bacterium]
MPNFKNIFRYMRHYGLRSTVGLVREKVFVDKKRFDADKRRALPSFPTEYSKAEMPSTQGNILPQNVMYCLHYFYPKKRGGTERFTLNLAKENIKRGGRSTVLVLEANEPESAYTERLGDILYRYYEYDGVSCIGFRYKRAPLGLYYKRIVTEDGALEAFAEHICSLRGITLVHATYPQPFVPFLLKCKKIGIPYIVTCTDFCMCCHYATMVDDRGDFCKCSEGGTRCSAVCPTYGCRDFVKRQEAAELALREAELVTVPSEFVAKILSAEFPTVSFLPVNHGIDSAFVRSKKRESAKSFVYAGTISPLKGIHLLIEAFSRLCGEELSLKIYGSGDGKYEARLRAMADGRVEFMGAAPASLMPEIYSSADCVIIPSMWYETYNFVLREAMATGALVIAADIGAMSEAVSDGKNGFLFEAGSADSLHEALKRALDFDFDNYEGREFPTVKDEGDIYSVIYHAAAENSGK